MASTVIARRYAKALLALAEEQQSLPAVRADLREVASLLARSPELAWLVRSSPLSAQDKDGQLRALFAGRLHPLALRFLLFLTARHRLSRLDIVLAEFEELCDAQAGVVRVRITSAHPLTDEQVAALAARLGPTPGAAAPAPHVRTEQRVDPALLGGFQVQVGDMVRDFSLASQLNGLKQRWLLATGT